MEIPNANITCEGERKREREVERGVCVLKKGVWGWGCRGVWGGMEGVGSTILPDIGKFSNTIVISCCYSRVLVARKPVNTQTLSKACPVPNAKSGGN